MRKVSGKALLALFVLLIPVAAFAQAGIAGTVKDASGAVMPGVTVEASRRDRRGRPVQDH